MRIFFCAGEPSGDLHGANLIRALRRLRPDLDCVGFGGERMAAAGCRLLYPLCRLALMWFAQVARNAPVFVRLLLQADRFFRRYRPDAVVLIDYPGFNWWLARRAHAHGIPVFYFVPPQLWAWAGWRVCKMRRWVDHVLGTLPFEADWYRARGVACHYIGHPYFDELANQRLDKAFVADQQARPGTVVGLLPGSRDLEIKRNLQTLLRSAAHIHAVRPDVRFLVACLHPWQQRRVQEELRDGRLPVEVHAGRTPEIIHLARACIAVSGSVGLELLYRGKPSVVVYRVRPPDLFLGRLFKTCRFISLVNLLADRELFPEFLTDRCEAEAIAGHVLRWLNDVSAYERLCRDLAELRERVAVPGACTRAAQYVLDTLNERQKDRGRAAG
ncbi:MAG TPA: lipid-A-disaccharide synthase [Gemmataceae bacterium]|nr:lipid-A-disaccharide synthase [Gemmataceae bacterium]